MPAQSKLDPDFDVQPFARWVAASEAALEPLEASVRLLNRDLSWSRFGVEDVEGASVCIDFDSESFI